MSQKGKIKPVCTECGSDNVMFDAWAAWDPDGGDYELSNTFDDSFCEECEASCKVEWVEA